MLATPCRLTDSLRTSDRGHKYRDCGTSVEKVPRIQIFELATFRDSATRRAPADHSGYADPPAIIAPRYLFPSRLFPVRRIEASSALVWHASIQPSRPWSEARWERPAVRDISGAMPPPPADLKSLLLVPRRRRS